MIIGLSQKNKSTNNSYEFETIEYEGPIISEIEIEEDIEEETDIDWMNTEDWITESVGYKRTVISLENAERGVMIINSNQISCDILIKEISTNQKEIYYYNGSVDSRGSSIFNWDELSKEVKIGELRYIDEKTVRLKWLGFYDTITNTRLWVDGAEWCEVGKPPCREIVLFLE